jgi:stage II sporulation protein D
MKSVAPVVLACLISTGCFKAPAAPALPARAGTAPRVVRVQVIEEGVPVVREVPLEDYVRATAISEFAPAAGDIAIVERMLEVQAIISRTYAISHLTRHAGEGFDLCATTHCQLYDSRRLQTSRWAQAASDAVDHTAGMVLWFDGQPAQALYHADCGGHTSLPASVWGGINRPYLVALADDDTVAADAHTGWRYRIALGAMTQALNADTRTQIDGRLGSLEIVSRDEAGRAERVAIKAEGSATDRLASVRMVRGEEFRQILARAFGPRAIRSTWFDVQRDDATFTFEGRGFGHGVGLCQAGALARVRAGSTPTEVLAHYYPGATIQRAHSASALSHE